MTRLIGRKCKGSNVCSGPVLIGRGLVLSVLLAAPAKSQSDPALYFTCVCLSGGYGEGVPPVPIPNTEVKPFSADGTWGFPPGRVGRCRIKNTTHLGGVLFWPIIEERNRFAMASKRLKDK